jgi:hypothetical protein
MNRLMLCFGATVIAFSTAGVTMAAPPSAYLISAARYLNVQKEHGIRVTKAIPRVQDHTLSAQNFRETVNVALTETNSDWEMTYLKTAKDLPPSYTEIDQKIHRTHALREAAYKEWLGNTKYKDPAKVATAHKNFNDSLALEAEALDAVVDALKNIN